MYEIIYHFDVFFSKTTNFHPSLPAARTIKMFQMPNSDIISSIIYVKKTDFGLGETENNAFILIKYISSSEERRYDERQEVSGNNKGLFIPIVFNPTIYIPFTCQLYNDGGYIYSDGSGLILRLNNEHSGYAVTFSYYIEARGRESGQIAKFSITKTIAYGVVENTSITLGGAIARFMDGESVDILAKRDARDLVYILTTKFKIL